MDDNHNSNDGSGAGEPEPSSSFRLDNDGASRRVGEGSGGVVSDSRGSTDGSDGSEAGSGSGSEDGERGNLGSDGRDGRRERGGSGSVGVSDDGSGGGTGSDTRSAGPAKRGRHKRDCDCERCEARRNGDGAPYSVPLGKPKDVSFAKLNDAKLDNAKGIEKEAISIALTVLFESPKFMLPAGTADHWPLDKAEDTALCKRISDVVAMLPKRKQTAMMKSLAKIMPPLALLATGYMITAPRVALTRDLIDEQRRARNTSNNNNNPNAAPNKGIVTADVTSDIAGPTHDSNGGNGSATGRAIRDPFAGTETIYH